MHIKEPVTKHIFGYMQIRLSPVGYGWKLADDSTIDYEWTSGCIFPQELIDIICAGATEFSRNHRTMRF